MNEPEQHRQALSPGTGLRRYRLLKVLGVGGFGVTYLAEHAALGHRVAVKEYLPNEFAVRHGTTVQPKSPTERPDFEWGRTRFLDEAKTLARFEHRNLVRVRDFFEANRTAYMVMDFEEGEPLSRLLERRGSLPEDELERLVLPLADGLAEVHAGGFLHRDIKPSNVYVRKSDGSPVLLDFGAARQALGQSSRSLTAVASAGYAPPEQYESDGEQGPWTDVYGLSALCYRAITGETPTEATRRMNRLVQGRPDPLMRLGEEGSDGYSAALLAAVDRGLAVVASDRPGSVTEWVGMWSSRRDRRSGHSAGLGKEVASGTGASSVTAGSVGASAASCGLSARFRWVSVATIVLLLVAVVVGDAYYRQSVLPLAEFKELLGRSPDPSAADENGSSDLHRAASQGNAKAASWLLKRGADVNARDERGWTPLHRAARESSGEIADVLLASGGDVDARSHDGVMPLDVAAAANSREVASRLLASGAEVNARSTRT